MTLLAGRYTLEVPLGDSDLGTVWNAHDESGRALVAITLEEDADEATKARFRAHAKALVGFHHASLVHGVAEGDTDEGAPFVVEERLTGVSLADRLEDGPALTVGRVVEIGVALAEALAEVHHAGISHGDVEPGNILLVGEPGAEVAKLIGFGLNRATVRADIAASASLTSAGAIGYAAPEQARGEQVESALADQASLAAVIYAALGGRAPHIARDLAALAHAIGHDRPAMLTMSRRDLAPFASTLDRALSSDPKKRFADVAAFGRALRTAGTMARSIAATEIPLGERASIGEPPAPALPRAATIPKPAGAARAAVPRPGAGVVPRPGAAAKAAPSSSRTTEELDVADLQLGKSLPAPADAPVEAAAASPTATPHPAPKAPSATATPHPAPKAPSATATPHPAPKAPVAPPAAPKAAAVGARPPPPAVPAKGPRSTEDLDVSELEAVGAPREEGGGELDLAKLTASGGPDAKSESTDAADAPKTEAASVAAGDAPRAEPASASSDAPEAQTPAEDAEAAAAPEATEPAVAERAPSPPSAEPAAADDPGRVSLELTAEELVSDPGPPPSPKAHAEAAHPPPPPPPKSEGEEHEAHAKPPPPPKPHEKDAAHKPPPPTPGAKAEKKDAKEAAGGAAGKPVVDAGEPSIAFSPSMERIVEASAKSSAPSESDDEPAARPAWLVPAVVVGLAAIVGIAVLAMQSSDPPPTSAPSGHTLTVTTHEPPTTAAADAGAGAPPPPTTTAPPPTTTAPPPTTTAPPPPTTRVPPTTATPPATRTPPTTGTRPPPTTGTRPPTTATRPPTTATRPPTTGTRPPTTGTRPPTTGTRPPTTRTPPPTTTTRPTVVSDPGF